MSSCGLGRDIALRRNRHPFIIGHYVSNQERLRPGSVLSRNGNRLKRKTPFGAIVAFLLRFGSRFHVTHLLSYSACLTYCRVEMYRPPTTAPVTALKTNRCWPSFIDRPTMQVTYHEWI